MKNINLEKFHKIPHEYIVARAKEIHAELLANMNLEPQLIDLHLKKEAQDIHCFMFGSVPARVFRDYVDSIHTHLKSPNWLAGWLGVSYVHD